MPKLWAPKQFRLFISHKSEDSELATAIKTELMSYGIDGFVAHADITPSVEWQNAIVEALDTCDAITPILTSDFRNSSWTDQEVGYCMGRKIKVLSLKFGVTPYGLMGRYQAMSCNGLTPSQIAKRIFHILVNDDATRLKVMDGLVAAFEQNSDFPTLITISKILRENQQHLTTAHITRLRKQLETDSNVQEAYWVPDRIRTIIRNRQTIS